MALTEQDKADIHATIAEAMKSSCMCGLSPDAAQEMTHIMGMVKDVGDGDRAKGIEALRDMLKWWTKIRKAGEKVGVAIVVAIALGCGSALAGLLWIGLKAKIGK